jgi:hypothetical protein
MHEDSDDFGCVYDSLIQEKIVSVYRSTSMKDPCNEGSLSPPPEDEDPCHLNGLGETYHELENVLDSHDVIELILKTGAFPIDSDCTLDLVAMCACLSNGDCDLAIMYFNALIMYVSRRHDVSPRGKYEDYSKRVQTAMRRAGEYKQVVLSIADNIEDDHRIICEIANDIVMIWAFNSVCLHLIKEPLCHWWILYN